MAYRNKVFASFDGDTDMHYYRLMCAWKQNDRTPFNFFDAHELCQARDTSTEYSIRRSLAERLSNAKVFVCLIGEKTRYLYRFVKWELEQAISRDLPIIGVNLNGRRDQDPDRCPPVIRGHLVLYVPFGVAILQHGLEHWPDEYSSLKQRGITGPRIYTADVYRQLGLS